MSSSATTSLIQAVLQASKRTFARSRNRFKLKEEGFVEKGSTSSAMVVAQKKTQRNHLLRQRYAQD